jgi:hypothetical protein
MAARPRIFFLEKRIRIKDNNELYQILTMNIKTIYKILSYAEYPRTISKKNPKQVKRTFVIIISGHPPPPPNPDPEKILTALLV